MAAIEAVSKKIDSQHVANYCGTRPNLDTGSKWLRVGRVQARWNIARYNTRFSARVAQFKLAAVRWVQKRPEVADCYFLRSHMFEQVCLNEDQKWDEGLKACDHCSSPAMALLGNRHSLRL